ncbi:MAG: DUF4381 domain-containing protein [Gammaproteobacteria bacterium]|nr:DUF4381 domain-containing protein [Gammaproteobacteria bacterium]
MASTQAPINQTPKSSIDFSQLNLPHSPIPGISAPGAANNQAQIIDPNSTINPIDQALKQLSDIALPADVSVWPPATGWWIVGIISLLILIFILKILYWRYKRFVKIRKIKNQIRQEIELVSQQWQKEKNIIETASKLSTLLRRYVLFIIDNQTNTKNKIQKKDIASISHTNLLQLMESQFKLENLAEQYHDIFSDLIYQAPDIYLDMDEKDNLTKRINQFIPLLKKFTFKALKSIKTSQLMNLEDKQVTLEIKQVEAKHV